jgi:hypothetical protein
MAPDRKSVSAGHFAWTPFLVLFAGCLELRRDNAILPISSTHDDQIVREEDVLCLEFGATRSTVYLRRTMLGAFRVFCALIAETKKEQNKKAFRPGKDVSDLHGFSPAPLRRDCVAE